MLLVFSFEPLQAAQNRTVAATVSSYSAELLF